MMDVITGSSGCRTVDNVTDCNETQLVNNECASSAKSETFSLSSAIPPFCLFTEF